MSERGVDVVKPYERLNREQIELIHRTSLDLLENPGILCYNQDCVAMLEKAGAKIKATREGEHEAWWVSIPESIIKQALDTAPSKVVLGARDPEHRIIMEAEGTRVHFGTGSETNYWLEIEPETFVSKKDGQEKVFPVMKKNRGNLEYLCRSAHLSEQLENLDFFLRNVNVQDSDITGDNKDVNMFFAALNHTTKPIVSGIANLDQLDKVIDMVEIIAGGREELLKNPLITFITSVIKSPLQVVDETAEKLMTISRKNLPVIISTSPQGGSTAPIEEFGMMAQVNAEVLAGIAINQLSNPGAPVIYGAVPVRARMDDLHDMYGVPEFCHYNIDCAQMARYYKVPCYSTAGVADAKIPGVQAAIEKMFTYTSVPSSAPDLVHYAFGLLDKTQTFSPEQAVLENHQIGMVKALYEGSKIEPAEADRIKGMISEVMDSPYRLYARYSRKMLRRGEIFPGFPFEGDSEDQDHTLLVAHEKMKELEKAEPKYLAEEVCNSIFEKVPGILPRLNPYLK